jgi:CHASE2 domain-containing sensor protein
VSSAPPATLAEQTRRTPSAPSTSALSRPLTGWRLADRIVTLGLLAYGLVNVIATSVQLFSFEQYANTILGLFGVDQAFTNVAQGQLWGTVAGIAMIVGWLLTAALTWRQLRRGRIAFWIPVAGALVVSIAVSIFITVPILNDPAFSELFNQVATSGS